LETLAAGMPVISSNIPAHQEIITQGKHGFLVNSAIEFREAVAQVSDSSKHRVLSENCRDTSRRDYGTWSDCMARYEKLYGMLK
jgi:glycosyltransferase involved in cell wall biosynthesis